MNALISELKAADQDFEFYPTTSEIISCMMKDMNGTYNKPDSILDIGAGNGKTLKAVKKLFGYIDLYAIEKSELLRELLDNNIYIIGTDFHEQSLFDKNIDVIFCNPPYSEYETWTNKIIREAASKTVYLVIPQRWKDSQEIKQAIKYRDAKYKTLGNFSFQDAEDRTARAIVDLVKIELSTEKDDAFNRFFDVEFKDLKSKFEEGETKEENKNTEDKEKGKFTALVLGKDYVKNLVQMYRDELKQIEKNYQAISVLTPEIMKEVDIDLNKVKHCLKQRRQGLKSLYWQELISRMQEITSRVISKKRQKILETIQQNGHVDFTEANCYAVVLWILKHAGEYIDEQLLEVYEEMIGEANCQNYKSNTRVYKYNRWRYKEEKPTHFFLEYRLVLQHCGRIEKEWSSGYRLSEYACNFLQDLLTVAYNLGFKGKSDFRLWYWHQEKSWKPGEVQLFHCTYKGREEVLIECRAHLNGNLHVRLNQKFALALNVEYGRLKGWLYSKETAAEELKNPEAKEYFKTNLSLLTAPVGLQIEHKPEPKIIPVVKPVTIKKEETKPEPKTTQKISLSEKCQQLLLSL